MTPKFRCGASSTALASLADLDVDAARARRSSSSSQIETDKTLKVSEISLAAAAHVADCPNALDMDCVTRVQICRKSYCGLLKWRLSRERIVCLNRFDSKAT